MITLTLKHQPSVPLEAEAISPDVTSGLDNAAIRALPVFLGKRQCRLDEFFDVDGAASDDASRVLGIAGESDSGCDFGDVRKIY